jgi:hypothetical protein
MVINIWVGTELNGETLDIVRSADGGETWTSEGIVDPATCVVIGGVCSFGATQTSIYVAAGTTSSGGSSGSGSLSQEERDALAEELGLRGGQASTAGDLIRATGDDDVFVINGHGYKHLFLNEIIFELYDELDWADIQEVTTSQRDSYETSPYVRVCEPFTEEVYAIEVTGPDTGILHHVQMTEEAVLAADPSFAEKIFCISLEEFSWYPLGTPYTSLDQLAE